MIGKVLQKNGKYIILDKKTLKEYVLDDQELDSSYEYEDFKYSLIKKFLDKETIVIAHLLPKDENWYDFFKEINNTNFEGWSEDAINGFVTCRTMIIEKSFQYKPPIKNQ